MNLWELTAPCHFGTEAVLKREILDLGYEVTKVEDGRVTFEADAQGVADANLFLRTTERVLLKVGEVKAETFDELFEKTKALPWESLGLLKKFVECLGFYFAYFQKDAFCGAEEQIGVCHTLGVCLKSYSSVFHFGHFITKVQYFTFQYRLCSEMAGRC